MVSSAVQSIISTFSQYGTAVENLNLLKLFIKKVLEGFLTLELDWLLSRLPGFSLS